MNQTNAGTILIVEDDPDVAKLEETVLTQNGYRVLIVATGQDALTALDTLKPDVVLLDVGLPDMSGLDVCTSIATTTSAFILMVSGHSREQDILLGLGLGADDYITKPFSTNELVARIASFLRRRERILAKEERGQGRLTVGDTTLNHDLHTVEFGDKSAQLTALEFRLLWFMASAINSLRTRAQILEQVWNDTSGVPTRVVDVHVASLRKKLNSVDAQIEINGIRGIGYRLDLPMTTPV